MIYNLIDAYVALLKVRDISTRIKFNDTYCLLRDIIAQKIGKDSKYVQEKYEEIALIESNSINFGMLECHGFKTFIGEDNVVLITNWPPLAKNYWDTYKYSK